MNKPLESNLKKISPRCAVCKIRSYSFCRCLHDDQLRVFSEISTEKEFKDKETVFLQQEDSKHLQYYQR